MYIDNSDKLNTTNIEPDKLLNMENDIAEIKDQLSNQKLYLLDTIYPVGSIYISVNNVLPESFLEGTWEQVSKGKALVGVDSSDSDFSTAEKTGGEKTHTLTVEELPSYSHTIAHTHTRGTMDITGSFSLVTYNGNSSSSGAFSHQNANKKFSTGLDGTGTQFNFKASNSWTGSTSAPSNANSGNQGSGQTHNNLQPYYTVYIWKRTR